MCREKALLLKNVTGGQDTMTRSGRISRGFSAVYTNLGGGEKSFSSFVFSCFYCHYSSTVASQTLVIVTAIQHGIWEHYITDIMRSK